MASLYKKTINGKPYWYLREMARVDGKPKMVSERYLGSAADIEKLHDAREAQALPTHTRHLGFGDTAAVWEILDRLDVAGIIDSVVGARRSDAGASVGTYLALAAVNRVVAPTSKLGFAVAMINRFGLDVSALALDMTNFATYIDSGNEEAPIAQRGKAKQKRTDLRLVGLGLVVTRDGGVPLVSHAYPGNKPDVTQFPAMIDLLSSRHAALAIRAGRAAPAQMTVVFDAGQNSVSDFARVTDTGLAFVGSIPPSYVADLLALPATDRKVVDKDRFGGLSAVETRRIVYGTERRVILTHSPTLHDKQAVGFLQTLTKAQSLLTELAETLGWRRLWPAVKPAAPPTKSSRRSEGSPATGGSAVS